MPEAIESVPNTFPALFAAYTVIWVLLSAYIIMLGRRIARLERKERSGSK